MKVRLIGFAQVEAQIKELFGQSLRLPEDNHLESEKIGFENLFR